MVEDRWRNEQCSIEHGLFFADDTYVPLNGLRSEGERRPIAPLLSRDPHGWADLDPRVLGEGPGLRILGGPTSWEGDGFLAVCDTADGGLRWLLHCGGEPFVDARLDRDVVVAVSEAYPQRFRWRIPLRSPSEFVVASERC